MFISRWRLILLLLFTALMVFIVALKSYLTIMELNLSSELKVKYFAENILLIAFLAILALGLWYWSTAGHSRRILSDLDKIRELSQHGVFNLGKYFNKMGVVGTKIYDILRQSDHYNELKSLKIGAQSNLLAFLIDRLNEFVLVADLSGRIGYQSAPLTEFITTVLSGVKENSIETLFEDLDYQAILNNLRRSKQVSVKCLIGTSAMQKTVEIDFYPINNMQNELSYAVGIVSAVMPNAQT